MCTTRIGSRDYRNNGLPSHYAMFEDLMSFYGHLFNFLLFVISLVDRLASDQNDISKNIREDDIRPSR